MPGGPATPPHTHMQKGAVLGSLLAHQLARSWAASASAWLILNVWCQSGAWHIVASPKASYKWPDRGLGWSELEASSYLWNLLNIRWPPPCCWSFTLAGSTFAPATEAYLSYFCVPKQLFHFSAPQYNQLQPQRQTLHTLKYMAESWYPVIQQTGKKSPCLKYILRK